VRVSKRINARACARFATKRIPNEGSVQKLPFSRVSRSRADVGEIKLRCGSASGRAEPVNLNPPRLSVNYL